MLLDVPVYVCFLIFQLYYVYKNKKESPNKLGALLIAKVRVLLIRLLLQEISE